MSSTLSKESKKHKINSWHQTLNYLHIYDLDYASRARTSAIFQELEEFIFDFFNVED